MPSSSGHHHRERQRAVKAPGDKVLPPGKPRVEHRLSESLGWSYCTCGEWRLRGNEWVTKGSWRVHVQRARRQEREANRPERRPGRRVKMPPRQMLENELFLEEYRREESR
jgi:hypothetical protein